METTDIVVIGAGIAGLSAAWALSDGAEVVVLEQEPHVASHASGRSAALISETYGPWVSCALAGASRRFLAEPPAGFAEVPLLLPRGMLWVSGQPGSLDGVSRSAAELGVRHVRLDTPEACELVPALREGWVRDALLERDAMSIDIAALIEGHRAGLGRNGGRVVTSSPVSGISRTAAGWEVTTDRETLTCSVVLNAAGAWADEVADRAGVARVGLQPLLRTAFLFPASDAAARTWPLVMDAGGRFYFEPEGDNLLTSAADETPVPPHDARADEMAISHTVDALTEATTLVVRGVRRKWAGLRTFTPDRVPVVGFESSAPGFFWLAGQGGGGIKTSPALAQLTRALVLGGEVPAEIADTGLDVGMLRPDRFR